MAKAKMMEKAECEFMIPDIYGICHPTQVLKNLWKCQCGLVWTTRHDAQDCETRNHKSFYVLEYGGYIENGIRKGHTTYTIEAVRKEVKT